ncbi:MAG: radical SAM protein [bacterium]
MKILLINPMIRVWAAPNCFPSGLGYIAEMLLRDGHEVEVYDMNVLRPTPDEFERHIGESDYDIAGVGGIITIYSELKELIGELKRIHPDRPVMAGGSSATSAPRIMMERAKADFLCIGEGEITVPELVRAIEKGGDCSDVSGIWRRDSDGRAVANPPRHVIQDINTIPMPRWDLFPIEVYARNPIGAVNLNKWVDGGTGDRVTPPSMNLISSRGCMFKCTFCYHDFMGAKYRYRTAANIYEEVALLKDRYGVKYIHFTDDCFITHRQNVMDFCDILIHENAGIEWGCAGRVNLMNEPLIARMKEAGCIFIGYGIESGSQKMLDLMKKKVTVEQAKDAILLTQKYLGWADCSFIVGMPGETPETIQETIDFCKSINLKPEVIFFATPYPGTELYDIALKMGKIPDEEEYLLSLGEQGEKVRVNFTEFSNQELTDIKERLVSELDAWNKIIHDK